MPPESYDALVVLGGGMNVHEADRRPYLRDEIALLEETLAARRPVLGVCLGAQLLAAAAGAEMHRARTPEIGWREVELCSAAAADHVVGALPRRFTAFQWHSYAFDIPFGAVELARNEVCPQAYRLGDAAWGVQFHPEVTEAILAGLVRLLRRRSRRGRDGLRPAQAARPSCPIACRTGCRSAACSSTRSWPPSTRAPRAPHERAPEHVRRRRRSTARASTGATRDWVAARRARPGGARGRRRGDGVLLAGDALGLPGARAARRPAGRRLRPPGHDHRRRAGPARARGRRAAVRRRRRRRRTRRH